MSASGRSLKRAGLLGLVVSAGLAMLAWSQPWFDFAITTDAGPVAGQARGDTAAPATLALSLAALALVAALALAGVAFRVVLGGLTVVLGASVVLSSWLAIGQPERAIGPALTERTGVEGADSIAALVAAGDVQGTGWPWLGVAAGVVMALTGALIVATASRWPRSGRRFDTKLEPVDAGPVAVRDARDASGRPADHASAGDERVSQWDALSHGDDPTDALPDHEDSPEAPPRGASGDPSAR